MNNNRFYTDEMLERSDRLSTEGSALNQEAVNNFKKWVPQKGQVLTISQSREKWKIKKVSKESEKDDIQILIENVKTGLWAVITKDLVVTIDGGSLKYSN